MEITDILQDIPYCGPEKETCVKNQTVDDKACLISCAGLYADITDDSLKQSVQEFEKYVEKGNTVQVFTILQFLTHKVFTH